MTGKPLGTDPLSGLNTPGERSRDEKAGELLALPRKSSEDDSRAIPKDPVKPADGPANKLEEVEERLAALEKRAERSFAALKKEASGLGKAPAERDSVASSLRKLDDQVSKLAEETSRFAKRRRPGVFQGARSVAKVAGDMVTPEYYTRKLGEFGLRDRSSRVDEFGMDPVYRSSIRPVLEFLFRKWWRVKLEGVSNIPDRGPALLVGNHAGIVPYDAAMVAFGVENRHPAKRRVRFLIEDWFATLPFANPLLVRSGAVRAHRENAERLLRTGHLVGAFPEGTKGSLKLYKDRYRVQRFGRGGAVRIAMRTGVPIVPFAIVGSEEIYPVLAKANWLGRAVGLGEFPISANLALGPLGIIPFPSKWVIRFGEPIHVGQTGKKGKESDLRINKISNQLRSTVQEMVDKLLARRKSVWRN